MQKYNVTKHCQSRQMLGDCCTVALSKCNNTLLVFVSKGGSLSLSAKDLEEEGKDVDDVEVNAERGEDVLLWAHGVALVPHEELGVEGQKL